VLPVHLYGLPVDLDAFDELTERHGLALVADAAQAHDATCGGAPIGGRGRAACWSFYPGKNLGAFADAGAVTTDDDVLARRLRRLRNYGSEEKYHNIELGTNSRLDELQAAFLRVKLAVLPEWTERRRRIAATYGRDLPATDRLILPSEPPGRGSAWHLYVVRTPDRDALQAHLTAAGIGTLIHYPVPPHRQGAYAHDPVAGATLPIADELAATVLSLPMGPHLSDAQVERVIAAVRSFFG
jgi:dTDP-3-amino-3,4,6-trideoxy-alpha-D-glucose transaminase